MKIDVFNWLACHTIQQCVYSHEGRALHLDNYQTIYWVFLNRAAMGRARFMVYPWFILFFYFFYFFFSFVGDHTQTSTRPNFE